MDLEGYWQENKRFVARVAGGALVFVAGILVVDALYASDATRESARVRRLERELGEAMYGAPERDLARVENQALREAVERLSLALRFVPRPELSLDGDGSPANRYLRASTEVRERVLTLAGRANVAIEPGLGLPKLSPTSREEIERTLEALDVIECLSRYAIDARVRRVEDIQVRLDPGLTSRSGPGPIERTEVRFSILGDSRALTRVLAATQRPPDGPGSRVLRIAQAEVVAARGRERELRLDLTLVVPRLQLAAAGEDG